METAVKDKVTGALQDNKYQVERILKNSRAGSVNMIVPCYRHKEFRTLIPGALKLGSPKKHTTPQRVNKKDDMDNNDS